MNQRVPAIVTREIWLITGDVILYFQHRESDNQSNFFMMLNFASIVNLDKKFEPAIN